MNSKKAKYLTKTAIFAGHKVTLYSLDGQTWSSRPNELHVIAERHANQRVLLDPVKDDDDNAVVEDVIEDPIIPIIPSKKKASDITIPLPSKAGKTKVADKQNKNIKKIESKAKAKVIAPKKASKPVAIKKTKAPVKSKQKKAAKQPIKNKSKKGKK